MSVSVHSVLQGITDLVPEWVIIGKIKVGKSLFEGRHNCFIHLGLVRPSGTIREYIQKFSNWLPDSPSDLNSIWHIKWLLSSCLITDLEDLDFKCIKFWELDFKILWTILSFKWPPKKSRAVFLTKETYSIWNHEGAFSREWHDVFLQSRSVAGTIWYICMTTTTWLVSCCFCSFTLKEH